MATPRRRSARLQKNATPERALSKNVSVSGMQLHSVIERDETPENGPQPNLNALISTPNVALNSHQASKLAELSALKTPRTNLPKPAQSDMHPELIHKSTTKAPDSGLRLGFGDITTDQGGPTSNKDTPTKCVHRMAIPEQLKSPNIAMSRRDNVLLSKEAQQMMDEVHEKAIQIKESIRADRDAKQNADANMQMSSAVGRRIAKPKGKASRFSDVHMAEFKKMDSIANHPSAFRVQPGFAQPTVTSLKRKGSKADLDDTERPRTAGKGASTSKPTLPSTLRPVAASTSRFGFHEPSINSPEHNSFSKRLRKSMNEDVSAARPASSEAHVNTLHSSNLPRPKSMNNLFSPTKASLARSAISSSAGKSSLLPHSASSWSLRALAIEGEAPSPMQAPTSTLKVPSLSKAPGTRQAKAGITPSFEDILNKEAAASQPAVPKSAQQPAVTTTPSNTKSPSKLPTFSGLKSILRRTTHRPFSNDPVKLAAGTHVASPSGNSTITDRLASISTDGPQRAVSRRSTFFKPSSSPEKHVQFTPSVKSKHDLAAASPSPAKGLLPKDVPDSKAVTPRLYDPAAYVLQDEMEDEDAWESDSDFNEAEAGEQVLYPTLAAETSSPKTPTGESSSKSSRRQTSFIPRTNMPTLYTTKSAAPAAAVAPQQQRPLSRHDPGFKSIFTTLKKPSSKASPATIRRVREEENFPVARPGATMAAAASSGESKINVPYPDLEAIPHGLTAKKKRRRSSSVGEGDGKRLGFMDIDAGEESRESMQAKKRKSFTPMLPGGWGKDFDSPSFLEQTASSASKAKVSSANAARDNVGGEERAKKRMRMSPEKENVAEAVGKVERDPQVVIVTKPEKNKKSKGREAAREVSKLRKKAPAMRGVEEGQGKGMGALSLSRLNVLARPKERRG